MRGLVSATPRRGRGRSLRCAVPGVSMEQFDERPDDATSARSASLAFGDLSHVSRIDAMMPTMALRLSLRAHAGALALTITLSGCVAGGAQSVTVDVDDIGGAVTGPNGPEAGVWVIAATRELSTPFVRIVVTDDRGRFLVPDLPDATYEVWVRGYGLVDSPKQQVRPGGTLELTAVAAP